MKIAVLGGGNGSFAAAGDFALQGHEVRLWRRDSAAVAEHRNEGSRVVLQDSTGRHEVQLALVTADIANAVRGAELILCPTPAFAQPDIARRLAPHLTDGQVVFLPASDIRLDDFAKAAYDAGNRAAVAFRRNRHAAMVDAQAWRVRDRHHHPRQAAASRRLSTDEAPITPST